MLKMTWLWVCVAVMAVGCSDCEKKVIPKDVCLGVEGVQAGENNDCSGAPTSCGEHYACRDVKEKPGVKCCLFTDRACSTESDCCPGQTCPETRKRCFDKAVTCTKDEDCGDKGDQTCEVYSDANGTAQRCRHRACGQLGECPDGQSCFQGECLADLPCGGTCEPGKACVPSADRCQDYTKPTDRPGAACPMSCNTGFIATFNNNRNIWDSCTLSSVQCVCAELPALRSDDLGRFSAIAADPGTNLFVSEYDGQYGDLVVARYGLDGKRQALEYVDGVPAGAVKYGPSGARGGIVEPGPDVGRYTDVAVNGHITYVSYYDVTNGDLKVAVRNASGTWSKHTVDGMTGDVGMYSSIAVDGDGKPGVSYFMRAGEQGFDISTCPMPRPMVALKYVTALKFAHATTATPASASDWQVKTVACLERPPPPCDACMGVCADTGNGPQCYTASSACTADGGAACNSNTESCVAVNGAPKCGKKYNPSQLLDVPLGVGVFSSLAFNGNEAIIAFMQRARPSSTLPDGGAGSTLVVPDGDLFAVKLSAQNVPGTVLLIDGVGDTGFFPDVKVDPSTRSIGIAYHDFTSKSLKYYFSAQLQSGVTPEVVDRGVDAARPGEQSFVGTDTGLVFAPSGGKVWIVYQDATRGDLKLATRTSSWRVEASPSTAGAVGFFADGVFSDGKLYASHARIHARLVAGEPRVDNSLILEQLTPP